MEEKVLFQAESTLSKKVRTVLIVIGVLVFAVAVLVFFANVDSYSDPGFAWAFLSGGILIDAAIIAIIEHCAVLTVTDKRVFVERRNGAAKTTLPIHAVSSVSRVWTGVVVSAASAHIRVRWMKGSDAEMAYKTLAGLLASRQ